MPTTRFHVKRLLAVAFSASALFFGAAAYSQHAEGEAAFQRGRQAADQERGQRKAEGDELTLEKFFPERSPFGPSATGITFSQDGRFAAYLYRPYDERRHGSDLYIYDTQTGASRRVTSASRMAEFQADTRKVVEDRIKKAREAKLPKVAEIEGRGKKDDAAEKGEEAQKTEETAPPTTKPAEKVPDGLDVVIGGYGGQIGTSSQVSKIEPGTSFRLSIARDGDAVNGVLHAGLVRLPLRQFKLEGDVLTAMVGDGEDGMDGVLEATVASAGESTKLSGTVKLTQPPLEVTFEAERNAVLPPEAEAIAAPPAEEKAETAGATEVAEVAAEAKPAAVKREYARGILKSEGESLELGDLVTKKDAEDTRAPRYGGVQSIEWSPAGHELLVLSGGDIYLLKLDDASWEDLDEKGLPYRGDLERLTRTRERESSVAFLPDGSGYTYLRDGALLRVSFGDHTVVQLDPALEDGEEMVGYRISPDMNRLVFLAQKRLPPPGRGDQQQQQQQQQQQDDEQRREMIERLRRGGGERQTQEQEEEENTRQVTIISYRDRFATARQVRRQVADDDHPPSQVSIYLYDLRGHGVEEGLLQRVFTRKSTGPRDVMAIPEWSPDSRKVAFAAFEQSTGQVNILEAGFDVKTEADKKAEAAAPPAPAEEEQGRQGFRRRGGGQEQQREEQQRDDAAYEQEEREVEAPPRPASRPAEASEPEFKIENAKVVYRFLHNGGPNTPRMIIPQYLADSRHMVFITELSGFRHLHVLDPVYEQLRQITSGRFEVYPFHISKDHSRLFVTATVEEDPSQEWVYQVDLATYAMKRLCSGEGVMSRVAVSDDGRSLMGIKADFGAPSELVAFDCSGEESKETVLSDFNPEEAHKLTAVKPEYFHFENRHGQTIFGHMFKPKDWKPTDKRPLLIYVYGGPLGDQKMISRGSFAAPSYYFARYMAEKHGWVTATVDPRGASGFGAAFEKANFEQVGKPQTEDLVDAAAWLTEHAGVDPKRRALHGWSFGGFQTQMVMYSEPDAFAVGIAGAGPTEWQNYNSWYTTGTVAQQSAFKEDLDKYSLLPIAKNLKGRLLLVHGMEDSNVLFQDTVRVYRELLRAGKEHRVDLFLDPTGGHGMGGDVKTIGQYRKYEDFLLTHVGKGQGSSESESDLGEDRTASAKEVDEKAAGADASN